MFKYTVLFSLCCLLVSCASRKPAVATPPFEGVILYELVARDRSGDMTDDEMRAFIGTRQTYTISGGQYRSDLNGSLGMNQIYPGGDTLFTEMRGLPGIFFTPVASNKNAVISSEITRDVATVAGVRCDLLKMTTENGTTEYYFNRAYSVNAADFAAHEYGNWKYAVTQTGCLPLKSITDESGGYYEMTALDMMPGPVDKAIFAVPSVERLPLPE